MRGHATGSVSIRVAELLPGGDGVGGLPGAVDTAAKVRHDGVFFVSLFGRGFALLYSPKYGAAYIAC